MTTSPVPDLPATTLPALLALLPCGVVYYTPVLDAAGQVVDFQFAYLNPAAQRLLGLPARPATTYLQQWPGSVESGAFAFHHDTYLAGTSAQLDQLYRADGYDAVIRAHATRLEEGLLVSFTDSSDQPRTAVEDALRASQAREQVAAAASKAYHRELQRVLEQAPVAIAVYRGPRYTIELANPTVCRLWGRTAEQLIGKGLFEALPEVAGMGYEQLLDRVMATGEPHVAHAMEAVHERGGRRETVYWDFVYVPMYNDAGLIDGAMVVATEVTTQVLARQQVEQLNQVLELRVAERTTQLTEQQRLLSQILAQVPAAIATLTGPEHRYIFFNEPYQALSAHRTVLGHTVAEVFPEVVEQGFIGLLDQVYATGRPFIGTETLTMLHDAASGQAEQRYVDFVYQPLQDGQQQTQGILAFVLDVTDRVRARKQAETLQAAMLAAVQRHAQQRQNLYQIFEQTPAAIVLLREPDHRIDYFNPAFEALFPPEDWTGPLHGHTLAAVYPRIKLAGLTSLLDHVYDTGEPRVVIEMALADLQPGSPRYVTFAYQAYREEGRIVGVAAFVYDVTEQVLAREQVQTLNEELAAINEEMLATNEELRDSNARLVRTNTDLDTFVYTASHDLKAPISNIEGLLLALRHDLPADVLAGPLVARLFDLMQGSVARFQQTIGHLTDISQLQQTEAPETVDLAVLVGDVRLDLAPLLEATPATLTVAVDGCRAVRGAPKTLRSVVYNLLSNAVKYRAPGRPAQVELRARCTAGRLVLTVRDNGLGLDNAQQAKLFSMFRRLHSHVEGSGVGLFMVKRLVENAGGTIAVESQPGVGSTFTVSLPA